MAWEDARQTLLAQSPAPVVMSWIFGQLLFGDGFLAHPPTGTESTILCNDKELARQEDVMDYLTDQPSSAPDRADDVGMVDSLIGRASYKGTDIRVATGVPFDPRSWEVVPVPARYWRWKTVMGWRWRTSGDHITGLEARAVLSALRWRARRPSNLGMRGAHFVDSRAVMGSLTKGRSSSRILAPILEQVGALVLAASFTIFVCYIHTSDNPADAPSRWFEWT